MKPATAINKQFRHMNATYTFYSNGEGYFRSYSTDKLYLCFTDKYLVIKPLGGRSSVTTEKQITIFIKWVCAEYGYKYDKTDRERTRQNLIAIFEAV